MRNINVRNKESDCKILDQENMMVICLRELKEENIKYRQLPNLNSVHPFIHFKTHTLIQTWLPLL